MSYVIGGGMAGLIWTWFHRKSEIIAGTDLEERQDAWDIPLPQYIYDTPWTERFLREVRGKVPSRKPIAVGVWYKGDFVHPTSQMIQMYWEKTRGIGTLAQPHAMSSGRQFFTVFDLDFHLLEQDLIEDLWDYMTSAKVERVSLENKEMLIVNEERQESGIVKFDNLVVTIPQPLFWSMVWKREDRSNLFFYKPITILKAKIDYPFVWKNSFDYIIYPDPHVPWYRLTKGEDRKVVGLESTLDWEKAPGVYNFGLEGAPLEDGVLVSVEKMKTLKYGKIGMTQEASWIKEENITFFGRYGAWDGRLKIHDLIKEASEHAKREMPESMEGGLQER